MHPRFRKHLLACALLAGLGAAAQAQQQPPAATAAAPAQGHHRHDPAQRAAMVNKHLADLKQKLQVTSAQESAWSSFSAAMQPTAHQRPDRSALAAMPTPDRLDHLRALRDQRNAEMDRRAEATKAFYAVLTPEQQKTFDGETARRFAGPRGGGMHHRPHAG